MERIKVRRNDIHISRNPIERFLMRVKDFCKAHRKIVLGSIIGVLATGAVAVVLYVYFDSRNASLLTEYETIMDEYRQTIGNKDADSTPIVEKLSQLKDKASFGSVYRSCLFAIGNICYSQKKFTEAEEAMATLADETSSDLYGPMALLTAAAAAEELGNTDKAMEFLRKAENDYGTGVFADRIIYGLGRVSSIKGDTASAKAYYSRVITDYPASALADAAKKRLFLVKANLNGQSK